MRVSFCKSLPELRCVKATFVHISKSHILEKAGCLSLTKRADRKSGLKKHFLHFKSANKWAQNRAPTFILTKATKLAFVTAPSAASCTVLPTWGDGDKREKYGKQVNVKEEIP